MRYETNERGSVRGEKERASATFATAASPKIHQKRKKSCRFTLSPAEMTDGLNPESGPQPVEALSHPDLFVNPESNDTSLFSRHTFTSLHHARSSPSHHQKSILTFTQYQSWHSALPIGSSIPAWPSLVSCSLQISSCSCWVSAIHQYVADRGHPFLTLQHRRKVRQDHMERLWQTH